MAEITLPQLGETVTEGTITRWFKKIGETVAADEPLFEVSTDKVDTEVPSPIAGVLTEIRVQEGDTVAVGTVIAVVGDSVTASDASATLASSNVAEASSPSPVATAPTPAEAPQVVASSPAPAPAPAPAPVAAAPAPAAPAPTAPPAGGAGSVGTGGSAGVVLSPVVRKLISENGLDASRITGTGPGGRITRDDVVAVIERGGATSAPAAPIASAPAAARPAVSAPRAVAGARDEVVPLSKIRQATGAHMVASKAISPHVLSVVEVDFANVDAVRNKVKEEFKATEGFSLTYLPFIARAVVDALGDFPHLNASVGEQDLIVHRFVDLGIAVDMDYHGLLVPVVRDAESKRLRALAREINDLGNRARTRRVTPDEITGGTFTISNNGSAGSVLTMPVINQPQVAVLSTDAIAKKPVVVEIPGGGESIAIHPVGNLAMAWDHRAFDGAYAAGFLVRVKTILETRDWSSEV
jgi:2-oxoglutarate dehydrogenase E2 component (dihydrolipoamide succinyltransferase)